MDVGIVGAPGSGRTTVFRALLAHRAPREAGTRHGGAAVGAIQVQDPRLERVARRFEARKVTPIEIRIHDLCPSLEPAFPRPELEAMRRMDVLLLVIPGFAAGGERAPLELDRLLGELVLEDLAAVEKRLRFASRDKLPALEREALERAEQALEAERPLAGSGMDAAHHEALVGYGLLTDRAFMAVYNAGEAEATAPPPDALAQRTHALGLPLLALCAELEAELAELPPEERATFLREYGVAEPAGAALTRALLEQASMISFFTVNEDECRAWPIRRGTPARRAAGRVHSDMERGFIRAEVIGFEELEALDGGLAEARRRGLLRVEGKDYAIRDGEIVRFRFNV